MQKRYADTSYAFAGVFSKWWVIKVRVPLIHQLNDACCEVVES
jgi:hypothetical protein